MPYSAIKVLRKSIIAMKKRDEIKKRSKTESDNRPIKMEQYARKKEIPTARNHSNEAENAFCPGSADRGAQ